ncbi:MAG TPA: hypothetical protein VF658_18355 [Pyrinomonadaceae bacterium]
MNEIVAGLLSLAKKIFKNKTITAKLRKTLTINKVTVGANVGVLVFCIWRLLKLLPDPSPVTRSVVFNIASYLALAALSLARIDILSYRYMDEKARQRKEQAELAELQAFQAELKAVTADIKETSNILSEGRKERKTPAEPADDKKSDPEK